MTFTVEQVREIAGQAAGAASGVFLRKHPDEVMPTEEVSEAVNAVLRSFGIDPESGAAGYSRDQLVGQAHAHDRPPHGGYPEAA